jgi:uncharacterized RDD family membrane protein YckC
MVSSIIRYRINLLYTGFGDNFYIYIIIGLYHAYYYFVAIVWYNLLVSINLLRQLEADVRVYVHK